MRTSHILGCFAVLLVIVVGGWTMILNDKSNQLDSDRSVLAPSDTLDYLAVERNAEYKAGAEETTSVMAQTLEAIEANRSTHATRHESLRTLRKVVGKASRGSGLAPIKRQGQFIEEFYPNVVRLRGNRAEVVMTSGWHDRSIFLTLRVGDPRGGYGIERIESVGIIKEFVNEVAPYETGWTKRS